MASHTIHSAVDDNTWQKILYHHGLARSHSMGGKAIVDRPSFNLIIGAMIFLNALWVGIEVELGPDGGPLDRIPWFLVDNLFAMTWLGEMAARQMAHGMDYFKDAWNCFDFVLVILAVVDTYIVSFVSDGGNLRMLMVLRMVRMLRLARLLRLLHMFRELWLIIQGFINSLKTLTWVSMLMALLLYTSGVFVTMFLGKDCRKELNGHYEYTIWTAEGFDRITFEDGWGDKCVSYFGSLNDSMFTLYQVITGESWASAVVRPVLFHGPWMILFFLIFQFLTTFGLLNVIVGVVVENTLAASAQDSFKVEEARSAQAQLELNMLRDLFDLAASTSDGNAPVTRERFIRTLKTDKAANVFKLLNFEFDTPEELFYVLDTDKDGEMSIIEFIENVMSLKAGARAQDMRETVLRVQELSRHMESLQRWANGDEHALQPDSGGPKEHPPDIILSAAAWLEDSMTGEMDPNVKECAKEVISALRAGPKSWHLQTPNHRAEVQTRLAAKSVMESANRLQRMVAW